MSLGLGFNRQRYVGLLSKLIGETEHLQNNPPKFVPQEDRYTYYCLVLTVGEAVPCVHADFEEAENDYLIALQTLGGALFF